MSSVLMKGGSSRQKRFKAERSQQQRTRDSAAILPFKGLCSEGSSRQDRAQIPTQALGLWSHLLSACVPWMR